jgi:hypothetical protein
VPLTATQSAADAYAASVTASFMGATPIPSEISDAMGPGLALGQMIQNFLPGGSQDLQRSAAYGVPTTVPNAYVPAYTDSASYWLGYITGNTPIPLIAAEIGGGAVNHGSNQNGVFGLSVANEMNMGAGNAAATGTNAPSFTFDNYDDAVNTVQTSVSQGATVTTTSTITGTDLSSGDFLVNYWQSIQRQPQSTEGSFQIAMSGALLGVASDLNTGGLISSQTDTGTSASGTSEGAAQITDPTAGSTATTITVTSGTGIVQTYTIAGTEAVETAMDSSATAGGSGPIRKPDPEP